MDDRQQWQMLEIFTSTIKIFWHVVHHRYYVGAAPRVVIADVELAKEIMVKEFDNFRDRGLLVSINALVTTRLFQEICLYTTGAAQSLPKSIGTIYWSSCSHWRDMEDWATCPHSIILRNEDKTGSYNILLTDKLPVDFNVRISHRWFHC